MLKIVYTKIVACLFILQDFGNVHAYDPNSEDDVNYVYREPKITGDLTNFEDQKVLVLYRGIHFLPNKFSQVQRIQYINESHVNKNMYCSAAYELAGKNYGTYRKISIESCAKGIALSINSLDAQIDYQVKTRIYSSARYAFQELYSNNFKGFFQQLQEPCGDYEEIFENLHYTKNPLLSFSDRIKHPGKYGFGLKNYGDDPVLRPQYDSDGDPDYPIIGKLFGVILDEAAVEELKPLNVAKAHNTNEIKIHTHYTNDILSEREISIAGYIPGEYVVFEMPLQVPSFSGDYPSYYAEKYGLTKRRYNNFKKIFTDPDTSNETIEKKSIDLMTSIIETSYQDNQLVCSNCLVPKIEDLFDKKLGRIDARLSTLTLDYKLERLRF